MGAKGKIAAETPDKLVAFELWYGDAKRSYERLHELLRANDPPVQVSLATLYRWSDVYQWKRRAEDRDDVIRQDLQRQSMKDKKDFLARQKNVGRLLQQKAVAFLQDDVPDPNKPGSGKGGIKSDFAAIQGLKTGLELEKAGLEMPDQTSVVKTEVTFRVIREKRKKVAPPVDEEA